ncbi:hypothetical protein [Herminiimonas sp. CN]|uniref:hypothetical protein n=1 Tax=Herminiimonas sp. CN TaxID=1349818 RepID=UPI000473C2A0|nr:hypothetical protein [Herminiimonas sp. CN]
MQAKYFLSAFLLATLTYSAAAYERPFPANAKRGTMTPATYPAIIIDGKQRELSAGAQIFNTENTIEMPAALRGSKITVNFIENNQGQIHRIWMLNPQEAAKPLPEQNR